MPNYKHETQLLQRSVLGTLSSIKAFLITSISMLLKAPWISRKAPRV